MSKHNKRAAHFGHGWPFGPERQRLRELVSWMNEHEEGTHFYLGDRLDALVLPAYQPRRALIPFDLGSWLGGAVPRRARALTPDESETP